VLEVVAELGQHPLDLAQAVEDVRPGAGVVDEPGHVLVLELLDGALELVGLERDAAEVLTDVLVREALVEVGSGLLGGLDDGGVAGGDLLVLVVVMVVEGAVEVEVVVVVVMVAVMVTVVVVMDLLTVVLDIVVVVMMAVRAVLVPGDTC